MSDWNIARKTGDRELGRVYQLVSKPSQVKRMYIYKMQIEKNGKKNQPEHELMALKHPVTACHLEKSCYLGRKDRSKEFIKECLTCDQQP